MPKSPPKERKVVIVGITRLLTQSTLMLQNQALIQAWCVFPSSLASRMSVGVGGGELTRCLPFLHTQAAHIPGAREALPDGTAAVEEGGARPRCWADADRLRGADGRVPGGVLPTGGGGGCARRPRGARQGPQGVCRPGAVRAGEARSEGEAVGVCDGRECDEAVRAGAGCVWVQSMRFYTSSGCRASGSKGRHGMV